MPPDSEGYLLNMKIRHDKGQQARKSGAHRRGRTTSPNHRVDRERAPAWGPTGKTKRGDIDRQAIQDAVRADRRCLAKRTYSQADCRLLAATTFIAQAVHPTSPRGRTPRSAQIDSGAAAPRLLACGRRTRRIQGVRGALRKSRSASVGRAPYRRRPPPRRRQMPGQDKTGATTHPDPDSARTIESCSELWLS